MMLCALSGCNEVDVTEIFSPERFSSRARAFGLRPGLAFDLRTGWDFTRADHQEASWKELKEAKEVNHTNFNGI